MMDADKIQYLKNSIGLLTIGNIERHIQNGTFERLCDSFDNAFTIQRPSETDLFLFLNVAQVISLGKLNADTKAMCCAIYEEFKKQRPHQNLSTEKSNVPDIRHWYEDGQYE
ncbi:MAG: hypothetical protein HRU28_01705 [Rhizobiales bacterium]|nr:hypothetical protein [Hyphomicrobiales bacterium]